MTYKNIVPGRFISRPNRFIANVEVAGEVQAVHVKNTGRCRELLLPGAEVWLEKSDNPERKTAYDLISVRKGDQIVNMDSTAPNRVFAELTPRIFSGATVRPECTHGNSRFDFYIEQEGRRIFCEVKGVTLERDGAAVFPDAPTERGVKHVRELIACTAEGFEAYIVFIVKMKGVTRLIPNDETHPEFGQALRDARAAGVNILAYDCIVTEGTLTADSPLPVEL